MQNEYSLLCRLYDADMAELGVREDITLLAFSPLAAGLLTGKYSNGIIAPGTRHSIQPTLNGRATEQAAAAVKEYCGVARKHGLDPARDGHCLLHEPALRGVADHRGDVDGAAQDESCRPMRLELSADVLADIEAVRRRHPDADVALSARCEARR